MNVKSGTLCCVEFVRRATLVLRRNKTAGAGGAADAMEALDSCVGPTHCQLPRAGSDARPSPVMFKFLRPGGHSSLQCEALEPHLLPSPRTCDTDCSPSRWGLRTARPCAQLVRAGRLSLDKRIRSMDDIHGHGSGGLCSGQRFRENCSSVASKATLGCSQAHGTCISLRSPTRTFVHGRWGTYPIHAGVGLRQGCFAAPTLFRWELQDCMED